MAEKNDQMISLSTMFEIIRRGLMPFYTNKQVIIQEEPMEGYGETTRKNISEYDFIQRVIAEAYVQCWGEAEDLEEALKDQDEVTKPQKDLGLGLIRYQLPTIGKK